MEEDREVKVMVSSGVEPVNAVEGALIYDPKELSVSAVFRDNSVLNSWTVEPSINAELGEVSFGGFTGTSTMLDRALVLTLRIRPLRVGEIRLGFRSGAAVLAADGTGGNILSALNGAVYTSVPKDNTEQLIAQITEEAPGESGEVLGAATESSFVISSPTNPDQNTWYNTATSTFTWEHKSDTTHLWLSSNRNSEGEGRVPYGTDVTAKELGQFSDGVWYFHATRKLQSGKEETGHYRFQIDRTPPQDFSAKEIERTDPTLPSAMIEITATDTLSGVDHYAFAIDGGAQATWKDDGSHKYQVSGITPGTHELRVMAFDKAGNMAEKSLEITVKHLPPPSITLRDDELGEGDQIELSVSVIPSGVLKFSITRNGEAPVMEEFFVDESGSGIWKSALKLLPGTYTISAVVHDARGAASEMSGELTLQVASSYLGILKRHPMILPMFLGLIALLILPWFFWKKFRRREFSSNESHEHEDISGEGDAANSDFRNNRMHMPEEGESPPLITQGAVVLTSRKRSSPPITPTNLKRG